MERIMPNRLDRCFYQHQDEYEKKALEVLRSGYYVLGPECYGFEEEFARFVGVTNCVGVASGLDALIMGIRALGIGAGDEVIVQGNSYIASVMGITINNATPVFVEPDRYCSIDADRIVEAITPKTKAIMVVHLYGQAADMAKIVEICDSYSLFLIEDCAQSHGAMFEDAVTGSFGDIGCFSFYPSKNLGAFGDAGAVVTNHEHIAQEVRVLRNYGSEKRYYNKCVGFNSRLDELQAGLLRVKLNYLHEIIKERKALVSRYFAEISNEEVMMPQIRSNTLPVWHQFVLRCQRRDELQSFLDQCGIGTIIHYPIPPHLSQAYSYLGIKRGSLPITEQLAHEVLSIPLYNGMTQSEQTRVIEAINSYRGGNG